MARKPAPQGIIPGCRWVDHGWPQKPIVLVVNGIEPPGLNGSKGLMRMHWTARKRLATKIQLLIRSAGVPPSFKERVRVTYGRSFRAEPMDEDNLVASFKLVGDALVRLGILEGDSQEHLELVPKQVQRAGVGPFFTLDFEKAAP
jgi:hypothetical protein